MSILVFEDQQVPNLYPISFARPAMSIACGGSRLIDQLAALHGPIHAIVRPHLRQLVDEDFPDVVPLELPRFHGSDDRVEFHDSLLVVNARLAPSVDTRKRLADLQSANRPGLIRAGTSIGAALLPAGPLSAEALQSSEALMRHLEGTSLPILDSDLPFFDFPHDVLRYHLTSLPDHLNEKIATGAYREMANGVFVAEGATMAEGVVCRTNDGPIVLDCGASVGPFSYLCGPIYAGPNARILEHAAVKECVALGHTTKVGGEVEASIIEPYTNKQHHGFIGHSYLGSWVNLGAGTCNSDLKNTYGTVNMDYGGRRVPTGMQFVGAFIGDYAKSAINTGLFTGKTIGVCSMVYGFVTTNVPSFVNYARLFGQVTATPVEVMVAVQARMFARRKIPQRSCDIQLLHDMYELTQYERERGSVPLEPLSL